MVSEEAFQYEDIAALSNLAQIDVVMADPDRAQLVMGMVAHGSAVGHEIFCR